MTSVAKDRLKQVDDLLATGHQSWLFGAGISLGAGLPLMAPLTEQTFAIANAQIDKTIATVLDETLKLLPTGSHIEHVLSHLCDYIAIADRSASNKVNIGTIEIDCDKLRELHSVVLTWIAHTIRWGYVPAKGKGKPTIGSRGTPIVKVDDHVSFMQSLFNRTQAGISDRRTAVKLFTVNYDTLLEDALSLCCVPYWDGLSGGALGYRSFHYGEKEPKSGFRAHVIKLHGSIDWHLSDDDRVWRVRDGDIYPTRMARVLIYPQATKYLATQRDPFAAQFDLFRRTLGSSSENVLAVCGYSFGDEHINQEIEQAILRSDNKSTLLVFSHSIPSILEKWRHTHCGKRIYILAEHGLFVGADGPIVAPSAGKKLDWWTFSGVRALLTNGALASLS